MWDCCGKESGSSWRQFISGGHFSPVLQGLVLAVGVQVAVAKRWQENDLVHDEDDFFLRSTQQQNIQPNGACTTAADVEDLACNRSKTLLVIAYRLLCDLICRLPARDSVHESIPQSWNAVWGNGRNDQVTG